MRTSIEPTGLNFLAGGFSPTPSEKKIVKMEIIFPKVSG